MPAECPVYTRRLVLVDVQSHPLHRLVVMFSSPHTPGKRNSRAKTSRVQLASSVDISGGGVLRSVVSSHHLWKIFVPIGHVPGTIYPHHRH